MKQLPARLLFLLVLAFPFAAHGWTPPSVDPAAIPRKVPAAVAAAVARGRPQDVLIEFDHAVILDDIASLRSRRGLHVNSAPLLARKADRLRQLTQSILGDPRHARLRIARRYENLPLALVRVPDRHALDNLAADPRITSIEIDHTLYPQLAESLPFINQPDFCACEYGGDDTVVAVLDTGVDYTRAAFGACPAPGAPGCRVVAAYEAAPEDGMLDDEAENFHGTNVAGIVAGVAPDGKIAAVDVADTGGGSRLSVITAGIDWAIARKQTGELNIVAINLSLGNPDPGVQFLCSNSTLRTAIQNARAAGIITVASSGNDGLTDRLSFPACIPEVVSVGAVYDGSVVEGSDSWWCTDGATDADQVICFSNGSSQLTLLAPGAAIRAADVTLSGTSQAAPHATGAIALLRHAFPDDNLDETVARLTASGIPVTDDRNGVTTPRLNLSSLCPVSDLDRDCTADVADNCPLIANADQQDGDGDGTGDLCDECPDDPDKAMPGDCGCGVPDVDTDQDGTADCLDECPEDPEKVTPGVCGCGTADTDTDTDRDGTIDCLDSCPEDATNDIDGDGICGGIDTDDDGDGMPDAWEALYVGLNAVVDDGAGDLDGDGYTNLAEFSAGTAPDDDAEKPFHVLATNPRLVAGIDAARTTLPEDASFAVRINAHAGIDVSDPASVVFSVDENDAGFHTVYERNGGHTAVVRLITIRSEPDTGESEFWAVYDRRNDTALGNYAYGSQVALTVAARDRRGNAMTPARFDFQVRTEETAQQASALMPDSGPLPADDPLMTGDVDAGVELRSGPLAGAKLLFSSAEPVMPRFGPSALIPALAVSDGTVVGAPLNLQPPTIFNTPVGVVLPCPGVADVRRVALYYFNGAEWLPAMDAEGNVLPGGQGFIVPESRTDLTDGQPPAVAIEVYHFSGLQGVVVGDDGENAVNDITVTPAAQAPGGGGGGCFVDTAATKP